MGASLPSQKGPHGLGLGLGLLGHSSQNERQRKGQLSGLRKPKVRKWQRDDGRSPEEAPPSEYSQTADELCPAGGNTPEASP